MYTIINRRDTWSNFDQLFAWLYFLILIKCTCIPLIAKDTYILFLFLKKDRAFARAHVLRAQY